MKKNILLVGTYCSLNKGDQLMQQVLVDHLTQESSKLQFCLSSPFPSIDRKCYKNISIVKSYRRNLVISTILIFLLLLLPRKLQKTISRATPELRRYYKADIVIDVSGDMLTEDYGIIVGISHSIPLILAALLNKTLVIAPQSIGPFKYLKKLYTCLLSKANIVLCREEITLQYLIGLKLSNLKKTGDIGYLLKPKPVKLKTGGNYFCVAPSALLEHKFQPLQSSPNFLSDFAQLLDTISVEHNLTTVLVPHVETPSGKISDHQACQKISRHMTSSHTILDHAIKPEECKFIISKSKFTIAFRMHAAIASLSSYIPTIAIAYSHKTVGVMRDLGLDGYVIRNKKDVFDELPPLVDDIITNHDKISQRIKMHVDPIKDNTSQALNSILEL